MTKSNDDLDVRYIVERCAQDARKAEVYDYGWLARPDLKRDLEQDLELEKINTALDKSPLEEVIKEIRRSLERLPQGPWSSRAGKLYYNDCFNLISGDGDLFARLHGESVGYAGAVDLCELICATRWLAEVFCDFFEQVFQQKLNNDEIVAAYLLGFSHGESHSDFSAF